VIMVERFLLPASADMPVGHWIDWLEECGLDVSDIRQWEEEGCFVVGYGNGNGYGNGYGHGNGNGYGNGYGHGNGYGDGYGNGYGDGHGN
jgi:hypothetical protein